MTQTITRYLKPRSAASPAVTAQSHNKRKSVTADYSLHKYIPWTFALLLPAFFLAILSSTHAIAKEDISTEKASKVQVQETYGKLPLYFIQNDGQVDEKVKFYEKGSGHATYFTKDGVYLLLGSSKQAVNQPKPSSPNIPSPLAGEGQGGGEAQLIKLSFLNANPNPEIIATDQQEGKVNYFTGNDPKQWKTNVPTYKSVLYKEAYPGIDIKFYGNNRQMEYDVIVKPGADPSKVQFSYEGIEGLKVAENGDLEISLHSKFSSNTPPLEKGVSFIPPPLRGGGQGEGEENKLVQKKPVIYQEIEGKRVPVEGRFKIHENAVIVSEAKQSLLNQPSPLAGEGKGEGGLENLPTQFAYSFELASYDKHHPLIIDPTLVYSTYLGGSANEYGYGIAVDIAGNAYITGETSSIDFPTTVAAFGPAYNGGQSDVFIVKLDTAGANLIYATYLGGSGMNQEFGKSIAVDASGNAYITGFTPSTDFPTTPGAYDQSLGLADAFAVKLDVAGGLSYSTYLGGSSHEEGRGIAVDSFGNAYVTGDTYSSDFPTTAGAFDTSFNGGLSDTFVAKLDASGANLFYGTYIGGSNQDYGRDIAVDTLGNIFVSGETASIDFPVSSGTYDSTNNGGFDIFIAKIDVNGNPPYFTFLGGSGSDFNYKISLDRFGNVYATGFTSSTDFPVSTGAFDVSYNGGSNDSFVSKFDSSLANLIYSTYLGGSNSDVALSIAVDGMEHAYVTGLTVSSDFPITGDAFDLSHNGDVNFGQDAFIIKLNKTGTGILYSTYLGGSGTDQGWDITVDNSENIYVMGITNSPGFPTTMGAYDTTSIAGDAFVTKFSAGTIQLPRTGQTTCYDSAGAVLLSCAGTGQDGEIQAGVAWPTPRFTDNGDATVTDNLTGLMWTKDANLMASRDSGFDTDGTSGDGIVTWQRALDYVAKLNTETYLGYSDWRLPNLNELRSLVDRSYYPSLLGGNPFINVNYWSSTWSSTSYANSSNTAFYIEWGNGSVYANSKAGTEFVWPVRSGQAGTIQLPQTGQSICYETIGIAIPCVGTGQDGEIQAGVPWPNPRFTDNSDGTVTDNLTGLIWTQTANLMTSRDTGFDTDGFSWDGWVTWQHALGYVSKLNAEAYIGHTDWRLPNINELASLIDLERYFPALPVGHPFGAVQAGGFYWSSTISANNPMAAWFIAVWFGGGGGPVNWASSGVVWPVRGGHVSAISPCVPNAYYQDMDGDTYGNPLASTQACTQPIGYVSNSSDCNDNNTSINPGATEVCNGVDDNCNAQIDEGIQNTYYRDADNDTYGNAFVTTQACTQPSGYVSSNSDCNDSNVSINPGAIEVCNGVDDNCNGQIDEGVKNTYYQDADSDTYGNVSVTTLACTLPSGYVSNSSDCNDSNASINPNASEICNGVDDNCNGQTDEGVLNIYYNDADSDTYGNASVTTQACTQPTGYVTNNTDCNDGNASVNPVITETCNNIDDNCNMQVDEGCPSVEICDGVDNDLDSLIDEGFPAGNTSCGHDVDVTPNGETVTFGAVTFSGNTTGTLSNSGPTVPAGYNHGSVPDYHNITTTAVFSGTAKVCIAYDQNNFTAERALRLLHHNGIKWDDITTTLDTTANIICGNTTSFSPFIVAQQSSTAVTLSNLSATANGDDVLLTWSTRSEADNEGFVVLRGENTNGPFLPVSSMIPAVGGLGMKAAYTFTDSNVEDGKTYYYRLQDVDSRGLVTTHNVIPVTTVVAGVEKPSQKIQDQKQDIQSIHQEIEKKSGRDAIVEAEFPPTLILPRQGGGDNDAANASFPQGEEILDELAQPEKVIVPSVDHIVTGSSNLAEGRQKQSPDNQTNESSVRTSASASSSFSVTIEDEIGNLISISKMNNASDLDASANELEVKEDTGKVVLTWQGLKPVKGFVIYRAEKGKKEYSPITSLIPYIGIGEKDVLQYRFIDNGVKPGVKYDYRMEVVDYSDFTGKKPA